MIAKGIISAIDAKANKVSVILPEYDGIVSAPLGVYGSVDIASLNINDFVMVVFFNDNLSDGLVFLPATDSQGGGESEIEEITEAEIDAIIKG